MLKVLSPAPMKRKKAIAVSVAAIGLAAAASASASAEAPVMLELEGAIVLEWHDDGSISVQLADGQIVRISEGIFQIEGDTVYAMRVMEGEQTYAQAAAGAAGAAGAVGAGVSIPIVLLGVAGGVVVLDQVLGGDDDETAPVFTSSANVSVVENETVVFRAAASDENPVTFAITGGADASLFTINASTGVVTFNKAADFEAPVDFDQDGVYEIQITATDDEGNATAPVTLTITVTDANDAPIFDTASVNATTAADEEVTSGTLYDVTQHASDQDQDTLTYTLDQISLNKGFIITNGLISIGSALDFETDGGSHALIVTVSDGQGGTDTMVVNITLNDVNENPFFLTPTVTVNVDENATSANLHQAQASDLDAHASITYTIDTDAQNAGFSIDSGTGVLSLSQQKDYETDAKSYTITVTATDNGTPGLTATQTVTVNIGDVNEAPTFASPTATVSLAENDNSTVFHTAAGVDEDSGDQSGLRYTLDDTSIGNGFAINAISGAVYHTTGLNYEDGVDQFTLVITATDARDSSLTATQTVTVNLTDVDEIAPSITSVAFDNTTAIKAGETKGLTITFSEAVTDFDLTDLIVSGGEVSSLSSADGGKTWTATFTPDADASGTASVSVGSGYSDAAGNGGSAATTPAQVAYDTIAPTVEISSSLASLSKGGTATTLTFTFSEAPVSSFDINDITVTSGLGSLSAFTKVDDTTYTAVFTADDAKTGDLAVSIADSVYTDAAGNAGAGASLATPITIDTASPAGTITVLGTAPKTLLAGETLTLQIAFDTPVTGLELTDFTVAGGTIAGLATTDGGSTYTVIFTPTAGSTTAGTVTLNANSVKDGANNDNAASSLASSIDIDTSVPTIVSFVSDETALGSDGENGGTAELTITFSEAVQDLALTDFTATGGTLSALTSNGDKTVWTVTFTAATGVTSGTVTLNSYSDLKGNAGAAGDLPAAITIDRTAPEFSSTDAITIAENVNFSHTLTATDANTVTYSLAASSASNNNDLFTLTNGVLTLSATDKFFDFETDNSGNSNVYSVDVIANDGQGNTKSQTIAITVTDDTSAPSIPGDVSVDFDENGTGTVYTIAATGDDATVVYSLETGLDAADFDLDASTGVITFKSAPDHETKDTYSFKIKATNAEGISSLQTVTVNVVDINEAPTVITTGLTRTIDEGDTYANFQTVFAAAYADQDATDTQLAKVKITSLPSSSAGTLKYDGTAVDFGTDGFFIVSYADLTKLTFDAVESLASDANGSFKFTLLDDEDAESAEATFNLTVEEENDAPTISSPLTDIAATEDVSYTFKEADFGFNDEEDSGLTSLTITGMTGGGTLTYDTTSVTAANFAATYPTGLVITAANIGLLSFIAAADASGDDYAGLNFKVKDSDGAESATATLDIDVAAVDDPAESANVKETLAEDGTFTFSAGDFAYTDVDSTATVQKIVLTTLPSKGDLLYNDVALTTANFDLNGEYVILIADIGKLTYKPDADEFGTTYAAFDFKVDGTAGETGDKTFTFDVTSVNDPATSADVTKSMAEDGTYTFAAADFSYSDVDDTETVTEIILTSLPADGDLLYNNVALTSSDLVGGRYSIAIANIGNLTYKPDLNDNGAGYANFDFIVNGAGGETAAETFTFDVTAVNDAPTGASKTLTTNEDTALTIATADFGYSDVENSALTSVTLSAPTSGKLHLNDQEITDFSIPISKADLDAGKLKFVPADDANGDPYATFSFTVNDGSLDSATSYTMTVDVTAVEDPATSANVSLSTNEDTGVNFGSITLTYEDVDVADAGAATHFVIATLPGAGVGTLQLNNAAVSVNQEIAVGDLGNLVFTPAQDTNGSGIEAFTFKVKGAEGVTQASYTVSVDVAAQNDTATLNDFGGAGNAVSYQPTGVIYDVEASLVSDVDLGDDVITASHVDYSYDLGDSAKALGFSINSDGEISHNGNSLGTGSYDLLVEFTEAGGSLQTTNVFVDYTSVA